MRCGEPDETLERIAASISDLKPGQVTCLPFTGVSSATLLGVEGQSLVVRLPADAPASNRPHFALQWYVGGQPTEPRKYEPDYADFYQEPTKSWLIDVAVFCVRFQHEKPETKE